MYQIAIIGAGQLGSRHLQGLAKLDLECTITVIDPFQASLELSRMRFEEMPANPALRAVHYATEISALPPELDYVIVATTADVRLGVLQALLATSKVRYLLLEKVLFQRLGEYQAAAQLLALHGTLAWVNCPRRVFPLYGQVKQFFGAEPFISLSVDGGNWGLGCNSIHFLDLFGMLTGAEPHAISTAGLDEGVLQSKRKNFIEFSGTLRGRIGDARFELTSAAGSTARILVTLRSQTRSCVIDEAGGEGFFFDGSHWERHSFTLPFLSQLATSIAAGILSDGVCALPTFAQSHAMHVPLLGALATHASASTGTPADYCAVT